MAGVFKGAPHDDAAPRKELFVRQIPSDVTSEQLQDFFSDFAPVKHATVVSDPNTGESRGFGFVTFGSVDDAVTAIASSKSHKINGKLMQVDYAKPRERKTQVETEPKGPVEKRKPRLIIRNAPWSLRQPKELENIFSKFGAVENAFIPRGENNKMSGFAFVTMKKHRHAIEAIKHCKDLKIHGRPVAVDFAIEKDKWTKGERPSYDGYAAEASESDDDAEEDEDEKAEEGADSDDDAEASENDVDDKEDEEEDELSEDEEDNEDDNSTKQRGVSEDRTVFVRNVPYEATKESLSEHFEQFGPVAYALPVMDKILDRPRGTAFVGFRSAKHAAECLAAAPEVKSSSLLVADDVDPRYVYEGRILAVSSAVSRERAANLAEKGQKERMEVLGKTPEKKDRRNLFLLNEGRVGLNSKLAQVLTKTDLDIREKSYELRKKQLKSNPSLHLSMTRLAIRNLPRAMSEKALKALGRKAFVEFATEVKAGTRQPLSKEELQRSEQYKNYKNGGVEKPTNKSKKQGVVKQAKIIQELKGSGETGRSRGYGFLELRDHRTALMCLRWLNGHAVSREEIVAEGEEERENGSEDFLPGGNRRLVVEFAVENAQVLKRQSERSARVQENFARKRKADEIESSKAEAAAAAHRAEKPQNAGNEMIGKKRRIKKGRK